MSKIKLYSFFIVISTASNAQDIITSDGISMGPKSIFMEVCAKNMTSTISKKDALYNVDDFCNCMADELLPTYTKKQLAYYFTDGHMDEMLQDSVSNHIIISCIKKNIKTDAIPLPPPMVMHTKENEPLIDKLIIVSDYKGLFNYLNDSIISHFAKEHNWKKTKIDKVHSTIKFEDQGKWMYYNAYHAESREDLEIMIKVFETTASYNFLDNLSFYQKMVVNNYKNSIIRNCKNHIQN